MATVTLDLSSDLRGDLSKKINRVPMKYFHSVPFGDILSRVTNDVSTPAAGAGQQPSSMISAAAQFVGCLIGDVSSKPPNGVWRWPPWR